MRPTAKQVMKKARKQIGTKESPANSNRTKYGRAFGMDGVYWCAIFVWWCGWKAAKKVEKDNPIAKSASAAYIQDLTVSQKGGKWVMEKNKSSATRKAYLSKAKAGDIVSMDFGTYDAVRDHVGLVDYVSGNYIYCIEGNTSKAGSQSNGGMVCRKARHYSEICSAVRPKYAPEPSKGDKIRAKAKELAWPKGTPKKKYEYPGGSATKAFQEAIKKVYPNRNQWSKQPSVGASCDTAVGTIIRASGVDKNWPRGLDEIEAHAKKHKKKWKKLRTAKEKRMKPGDVIYQIFDSGAGHVSIYMGNGRIANAHYYGKTYLVIQSFNAHVKKASECRKAFVYRAR